MKKMFFLLTILTVLSYTYALASETKFSVPELNLEASLNESWVATTRDVHEGSKILEVFNINVSEAKQMLTEGNLYFLAYNPAEQLQLEISEKTSSTNTDFNNISDADLLKTSSSYKPAEGIKYAPESFRVFTSPQTKYLSFREYIDGVENLNILEYYTVLNGQGVLVTIRSYSSNFSDSVKAAADNLVNKSINFTKVPEVKKEVALEDADISQLPSSVIATVEKEQKSEVQTSPLPEQVQQPEQTHQTDTPETAEVTLTPSATPFPLAESEKAGDTEKEQKKNNTALIWIVVSLVTVIVAAAFFTAFFLEHKRRRTQLPSKNDIEN